MSKMAYPDRCVIEKGWFPQSAEGVDDCFVFVSIDFDLYDPTIEALRFYYPKVVPGGFLFVHDYNHKKFEGIKPAVREFCAEAGVNYAPLPDPAGSVMFVK